MDFMLLIQRLDNYTLGRIRLVNPSLHDTFSCIYYFHQLIWLPEKIKCSAFSLEE